MGFLRRSSAELDELRRSVEDLRAQVAEERAARTTLAERLERRLGAPGLPPPMPGTSLAETLAELRTLAQQVERVDTTEAEHHEQIRLRLDEVTTLLTNQLSELTGELEQAQAELYHRLAEQHAQVEELAATALRTAAATPDPLDDIVLGNQFAELRESQVRIANDLARHEIALRADLASLASLVQGTRRGQSASPRNDD
jgi:predicted nuclease with TOPRIM domain